MCNQKALRISEGWGLRLEVTVIDGLGGCYSSELEIQEAELQIGLGWLEKWEWKQEAGRLGPWGKKKGSKKKTS